MKALVVADRVRKSVESMLRKRGVELYDVEYKREPAGAVLRLYIDKEGGVNLDTCSEVSSMVGEELERASVVEGPYNLEVSSPGVERRLARVEHYRRFIGSEIVVKTKQARAGQRKFIGELKEVDDTGFLLTVGGSSLSFDFQEVSKANLVFKGM